MADRATPAPTPVPTPASTARPSVVQLAIEERAALYASYLPFIEGGGPFVPTSRPAQLGDQVFAILSLMDDPNKISVACKVVWVTPPAVPGRLQGIGNQFPKDEAGAQARSRIETIIGGVRNAQRPTHTL